ncbi:MAG: hypothetical protein STSR0002_15760 [Smithella sp.]|jgi:hypothetical protein
MVAPLRNKNSLEQTGFQLTDNGFIFYGSSYKYDDVVETKFVKSVFEVKQVGLGIIGRSTSISFKLLMNTGEIIQLTEQPTLISNNSLSDVERVQNIFNAISQKTWNNRVKKYEKQIQERGFFNYCGWNFYPQQKKVVDVEENRTYFANSTNFLKEYDIITVVSKDEGIGSKLLRKIGYKPRIINTITDTDVFFALLKHYFNLQWRQ